MISKGRSSLRAQIEDSYHYLNYLLDIYPDLFKKWILKNENECRIVSKEESSGDKDVELDIFNSLYKGFEYIDETQFFFNDAMLIAVYSYYESVITKIAKTYSCENDRLSQIYEKKGNIMSEESSKMSIFLYDKIRILRNQLCHNNFGTIGCRKQSDNDVIESLVKEHSESLVVDDMTIHIMRLSFVKDILEKEYIVLSELMKNLSL